MAGTGKYTYAALLAVVMIMVGTAMVAAADVTAPSSSLTMEVGAASMHFIPSLFTLLIASFIPFLASRFY